MLTSRNESPRSTSRKGPARQLIPADRHPRERGYRPLSPTSSGRPGVKRLAHHQLAAFIACGVLAFLVVFQILLALGLPIGRAAWGGFHRVLPPKLRWASAAAVPILLTTGWVVLAGAGFAQPGPSSPAVRILLWVFCAYFVLNTVVNAFSKSLPERWLMTPLSTTLAVCCAVLAIPHACTM
jgi:hypothetical protein